MQLTWPANYIKYWRFRGRRVPDQIATELDAAARRANTPPKNSAPLVNMENRLPAGMVNWRNAVRDNAHDAADSAGAYWAWSLAAESADRIDPFVRATITVSSRPIIYYTHQGFGRVAATVNVGQPSAAYASINGIQARFQAYTNATMILQDHPQFPNASGQMQNIPEDWTPRRP